MAVVATVPSRFDNILPIREFTESGAAVARVRIRGSPWWIIVDNLFPFEMENKERLLYGEAMSGESWV